MEQWSIHQASALASMRPRGSPFDTQELTVKLIVHCVLGGFVAVEFAPPGFCDEYTRGPYAVRSVPREEYNLEAAVRAKPRRIPQHHFKVDS